MDDETGQRKSLVSLRGQIILFMQIFLLYTSRMISRIYIRRKLKNWVVGPTETANTVLDLASALPGSISVNLVKHKFYEQRYDHQCNSLRGALIKGPILLGKLSRQFSGFIYVGPNGFLVSNVDYRDYEFRLLRKWGCKIVSYQVGSEIRSIKLLKDWEKSNEVETVATIASLVHSQKDLDENEIVVKNRAEVIDRYSSLVFNSVVDQMSYIQSPTLPNFYLVNNEYFENKNNKFDQISRIVVCHAPSNPVVKGTTEIREAIKTLTDEGFEIEYIEFIDVPHDEVLRGLRRAHIVVNELFAMMPGVFAIEALAHSCVLLTSADPRYEKDIEWGSSPAWIVTNRQNILQNLRWCLTNKESLQGLSEIGRSWAWENASRYSKSKWFVQKLNEII